MGYIKDSILGAYKSIVDNAELCDGTYYEVFNPYSGKVKTITIAKYEKLKKKVGKYYD